MKLFFFLPTGKADSRKNTKINETGKQNSFAAQDLPDKSLIDALCKTVSETEIKNTHERQLKFWRKLFRSRCLFLVVFTGITLVAVASVYYVWSSNENFSEVAEIRSKFNLWKYLQSEPPEIPTYSSANPLDVSLDCRLEQSADGKVRAIVETNLPNDTTMTIDFRSKRFFVQYTLKVKDGKAESIWFSNNGRPLPDAVYRFDLAVSPWKLQPQSVQEMLGNDFENVTSQLLKSNNDPMGTSLKYPPHLFAIGRDIRILPAAKEQANRIIQECESLWKELDQFKNDPEFHRIGFDSTGKFHLWMVKVESLQKTPQEARAVGLSVALLPEYLALHAQNVFETKGRPDHSDFAVWLQEARNSLKKK